MWHSLSKEEVFQKLETNENGLTPEEVKKRLQKYGFNKLPEPKRAEKLIIFFSQFKNPLIIILIIAGFFCLILKEIKDLTVILMAVFLNTLIGYWQEEKAERAIHQLRKMVEYKAKVIRNNEQSLTSAENLVPGDIVILEAGDIVLADARVIKSHNLQTIESVLTGESRPSDKKIDILPKDTPLADRENMVYAGTIVSRGKGLAVVVNTGLKTEFGKIATLIKETKEEKTPLQKKIENLAKIIGSVIIILALFIFFIGLTTGRPFLEILLTSIAVIVAGVPEGLVIAITVCLAIGMQRILKKKALIRKLIATETLGSVTTICMDKTGTLTEGKMSVSEIITFNNFKDLVLKIGLLCNNVIVENPDEKIENWILHGDETEKAILLSAVKFGLDYKKNQQNFPRLDEIPFDSERMWMATLHKTKNSKIIFVKGAPERILKMSSYIKTEKGEIELTKDIYQEIEKRYLELTRSGLRILAFAYKNFESTVLNLSFEDINNLVFVGLIVLKDPLRKEAKETIKECQKAGIRPIIVSGDHKLTTETIAKEIGLTNKEILEGKDLDKLTDEEMTKKINKINIFARVEPRHKIRIVDILQAKKEVVAMTGDGINDAPAIKSADIGISLASGTNVTKETADMVLLDDNFKTIVEAIKEGRGIFDNIKKIVLYLMASSFTEVILVGTSLILGLPLPVLPAQILWVNIIQDGPPAMALAYEKTSEELMKEKPRGLDVPILDKQMRFMIFIIGIFTNLILLALFLFLWQTTKDIFYVRTMIFVGLGIATLFYVFGCKNLKKNIWEYNPFDNLFLNLSVIFGGLMFLIAIYLPIFQKFLKTVALNFSDWLILIDLGLINLILIEFGKLIFKQKNL